jgi:5-methylcytosine-specific restriction endonuclease McrA
MTPRQRIRLWEEADGQCALCGRAGAEVDHIIPRSHFGKKRRAERDADSNLRVLCTPCHRKRHG